MWYGHHIQVLRKRYTCRYSLARESLQMLAELRAGTGLTVVCASHDRELVESFASHIVELSADDAAGRVTSFRRRDSDGNWIKTNGRWCRED